MVKFRLGVIVFVVLVFSVFGGPLMAQESGEKKPAEALLTEQGGCFCPRARWSLSPP